MSLRSCRVLRDGGINAGGARPFGAQPGKEAHVQVSTHGRVRGTADVILYGTMRIVMDTDVLVAALRSTTGASRAVYQLIREGMLEGIASVALFLAYEAVLLREEQRQTTGMSIADVYLVLDDLAAILQPVVLYFQWRSVLPDPDDEHVLEAAVNGQADVLVTFNVRAFLPAASSFKVTVLRPGELLRRL